MDRYIRLKQNVEAEGKTWYTGSVVDLIKHPEVAVALESANAARRSPLDKMVRGAEVTK